MIQISDIQRYLRQHPLMPSIFSMGWNLVYALFNGILGMAFSSWWFITLCAFYAVLGLMRLSVVTLPRSKTKSESALMRHNGFVMIFLSIVLVGMMVLTIQEGQNPSRNAIVMYAIAAYTTFLVVWTIRNTIKAHRQHSATMITLRNIACASTIGSVLSLERAMLGTFGHGEYAFIRIMEAATGAAAFVAILAIGVSMIKAAKQY